MGSGQPAIIYAVTVYPETTSALFEIIGHSSPDGSNGNIYMDLQTLTSAKSIVKSIKLTIQK